MSGDRLAHDQDARAVRRLTVKPGDYHDTCPLCGIHRQNAGFLRETCGDGYLKPECFVARLGSGRRGSADLGVGMTYHLRDYPSREAQWVAAMPRPTT